VCCRHLLTRCGSCSSEVANVLLMCCQCVALCCYVLQTLVDEMRIMLELDHPCIVACHGVFYELGMFKIVMEFCDAGSLLVSPIARARSCVHAHMHACASVGAQEHMPPARTRPWVRGLLGYETRDQAHTHHGHTRARTPAC
jgi:serine/threonine protein kinase